MVFGGRKRASSSSSSDDLECGGGRGSGGGNDRRRHRHHHGMPVTSPQGASDLIFLGDECCYEGESNGPCRGRDRLGRDRLGRDDLCLTSSNDDSESRSFGYVPHDAVTPVSSVGGAAWSGDDAAGGFIAGCSPVSSGGTSTAGDTTPRDAGVGAGRRRAQSERSSLERKEMRRSRSSTTSISSDFNALGCGCTGVGGGRGVRAGSRSRSRRGRGWSGVPACGAFPIEWN